MRINYPLRGTSSIRNCDAIKSFFAPAKSSPSRTTLHEQGGRLCDFSHRVEINPFVEAMDIIGLWPVDQRRNARIQAEEAIIGRSGRGPILQRSTENCLM